MTTAPPSNSSVHRLLCKILGGQDSTALKECADAGLIPRLLAMAQADDVLPALAVRCLEQDVGSDLMGVEEVVLLKTALLENTRRNMGIVAQALKLSERLNQVGITPLFLKGTARLLMGYSANVGFRKQVDIDLLVQPGELIAAGDALVADGYTYCDFSRNKREVLPGPGSTSGAVRLSAAHHHLLPLVKQNYSSTVELHRHFLPGRFQRNNPLVSLFASACQAERRGVAFKVPSAEYQLIHLVLGTLVNDGYLARRSFPYREACDLIEIIEGAVNPLDLDFVSRRCGRQFLQFYSLVSALMGYRSGIDGDGGKSTVGYIRMMEKRYNSTAIRSLLDAYARFEYLAYELLYSPTKLPAFLGRAFIRPRS